MPRMPGEEPVSRYCTFCEIVARREPAEILYEDDEVMVFRNRLHWVPVMLLAVPKAHKAQAELWADMARVGEIAVRMGREHCPNGFRLLSNFGHEAMKSQEHAHVHVLGGTFLGEYV
ncbi:MAG TPA: HIT domain-containing protein [Thermoleophilia bacterium]|nr:HIT domain-containing protein [Thermoleophilia bacterium]